MRGKQNSAIEILQDVFLFHEAASKTVEGVHDDASVLANILKKHSHQNMNDVNLVRSREGKDIFFGLSNQSSHDDFLRRFLNDHQTPLRRCLECGDCPIVHQIWWLRSTRADQYSKPEQNSGFAHSCCFKACCCCCC